MPPATKTCSAASAASGKVQRGRETPSASPTASVSWRKAEPPRPSRLALHRHHVAVGLRRVAAERVAAGKAAGQVEVDMRAGPRFRQRPAIRVHQGKPADAGPGGLRVPHHRLDMLHAGRMASPTRTVPPCEDAAVEAGAVDHGVEDRLLQDVFDVLAGDGKAGRFQEARTQVEAAADEVVQGHAACGDVPPVLLGEHGDAVVAPKGVQHLFLEQGDLAAFLGLVGVEALFRPQHVAVADDSAPFDEFDRLHPAHRQEGARRDVKVGDHAEPIGGDCHAPAAPAPGAALSHGRA